MPRVLIVSGGESSRVRAAPAAAAARETLEAATLEAATDGPAGAPQPLEAATPGAATLEVATLEEARRSLAEGRADAAIVTDPALLAPADDRLAALRRGEERFRVALAHAPITVATLDLELRYTWVHNTRRGFTPEQVIGRRPDELIAPEDAADLMAFLQEVLGAGARRAREIRGHTRGEPWVYHATAEPSRDERGEVVGITLALTDVTERKRIEDALREREALLRDIIDTIADPVYVKDAASRLLLVNPATAAAVGRPVAEIVGRTDRELYEDPALGERILEHDRRVMTSGAVHVFEETIQTPRGERVMLNTKAPRRDAAGAVVGLVGTARDITDVKRAEEAAREREERLRLALAAGRMATWDWDLATGAVVWNEEHFRMLGYAVGAVVPGYDAWAARLHPEDRAATEARVRASLEHGGEYTAEFRALLPDGTVRWLEARGRVDAPPAGGPGRQYGVMLDITERKRAEEALREADRRKDEFLAVLSHELRNPLAPIRNSLYVLERAVPGGEQARRAQAIVERQVDHLTRMVEDLLDVTRIARGKIQLRRERVDLLALVRGTVEDHRALLQDAGVELEASLPGTPLALQGDPTRLAQAVGNLLGNAAKFTPPGGRVRVSLSAEDGAAVLRVADTGMGIAPEVMDRLFEPFIQAAQALDRRLGGLGLGLALVKGLVEHHGGTIEASSPGPGRGATFTVRLPLEAGAGGERGPAGAPAAVARRRVLVIEDHADAADSLREVLELDGHEVAVAASGPAGLALARADRFDVVLCDIGLPGMDGYEVARAFRDDAALRDVCLIALTGYAQTEDVARAIAAGFDRHLAKPPSLEQIDRVLAEECEARRRR